MPSELVDESLRGPWDRDPVRTSRGVSANDAPSGVAIPPSIARVHPSTVSQVVGELEAVAVALVDAEAVLDASRESLPVIEPSCPIASTPTPAASTTTSSASTAIRTLRRRPVRLDRDAVRARRRRRWVSRLRVAGDATRRPTVRRRSGGGVPCPTARSVWSERDHVRRGEAARRFERCARSGGRDRIAPETLGVDSAGARRPRTSRGLRRARPARSGLRRGRSVEGRRTASVVPPATRTSALRRTESAAAGVGSATSARRRDGAIGVAGGSTG